MIDILEWLWVLLFGSCEAIDTTTYGGWVAHERCLNREGCAQ